MRRNLLIGLALVSLTLGVYWPVRTHDFIFFDDPQFITENPQIQSGLTWKTFAYAFKQPVVGNWHPLTTLSHAMDCQIFGLRPAGHHLVSAFIHAFNSGVLFFLLLRLMRAHQAHSPSYETPSTLKPRRHFHRRSESQVVWLSALGALLFALHPLRVESVAWVAERKDVLSGFFFLLSLWMYVLYAQKLAGPTRSNPPIESAAITRTSSKPSAPSSTRFYRFKRTFGFYAGALLCFALGLMSKPMVVTLPFVLLLLDFWPLRRFSFSKTAFHVPNIRGLLLEKVPFLVLSLVDCWITIIVQKNAGAMQAFQAVSFGDRLANAVVSYARYLGKFFVPIHLAAFYPHPAKHYFLSEGWLGWQILCAGLLLVLITWFFFLQAGKRRYLLFGWLWFLGTLIPVIGLVQVGDQAMADRYTYIPSIGLVLGVLGLLSDGSWKLDARFRPGTVAGAASFLVIAALLPLTVWQLSHWRDTITLFEHTISVTADNPAAHFAVGVGLDKQEQTSKAMVHYRVATAIDPHYSKAYYNMGQILRKGHYWHASVDAYLAAERDNPNDLPTQLNLASALSRVGRSAEAISHFERALGMDPNSIEALNNLAWLLATSPDSQIRNGPRAVELAEKACDLNRPTLPVLLGTLAAAYAEAGRFSDAVQIAEQALARAKESGDLSTAAKNKELLALYRANLPYRANNE
jgi:Flp pilus assembly protein TadD